MVKRPPIDSLTGLRFGAAISVAIAHGSSHFLRFDSAGAPSVLNWFSSLAGFGMPLFFVLSGFVIHYNYASLVDDGRGRLRFLWARFSRLYPLFLLMLFVDLFTNGDFSKKFSESYSSAIATIKALPWYIVFAQSWIYKIIDDKSIIYQLGFNMPLTWSVSTEWFFYIAFLFLAYPLRLISTFRPSFIFIALLLWITCFWAGSAFVFQRIPVLDNWAMQRFGFVSSVEHGYQDSFVRWAIYFSPYARIGEFVTGCLVSSLYISMRNTEVSSTEAQLGTVLTWLSVTATPIILFLMYTQNPIVYNVRMVKDNIGLAPTLAILIFCSARYKTWISRFLAWRPIVLMGEASYSIYLVHMLVFVWISRSTPPVPLPVTIESILFACLRMVIVLAIIIALSVGLYHIVEMPSRKWLRGLWTDAPAFPWKVLCALCIPVVTAGTLLLILRP